MVLITTDEIISPPLMECACVFSRVREGNMVTEYRSLVATTDIAARYKAAMHERHSADTLHLRKLTQLELLILCGHKT